MGKKLLVFFLPLYLLGSEGEKLYMAMGCYGCHGIRGEGIGDYPTIGGKPEKYLVKKLHDLKKGIGHTSKRELMIPFARGLSEQQIEALSRFLSRIETRQEEEVPDDILGGYGS